MRRALAMAVLLLGLSPAQAHVPANNVLGVWEWPTYYLPTMDGDIGEWEVIPDYLWLTPSTLDNDGNPLFHATEGGHSGMDGTEAGASDLTIRLAVAWNDDLDRLYFAQERFDDVYDRDVLEPPGECGGDDAIEIHVDADHSGGWIYYIGQDDNPKAGRTYAQYNGMFAQQAIWRWPPIGNGADAWHWMWTSSATWHDKEPYSCCADSYTIVGEHGTEGILRSEWWSVYFNTMVHDSPEESVIAPLRENQIIGMAVAFCDIDVTDRDGHNTVWRSGGPAAAKWYADSDLLGDWVLLRPIVDDFGSTVESNSWGQVKASFLQ